VPKVACIVMQKDEKHLLRSWIAYHGYLFGFENIFVFDNGSEDPETWDILFHYKKVGVNIYWEHSSPDDYRQKGEIIGHKIRSLDLENSYDFLIPLDCDEFIILETERGFDHTREGIDKYLLTLTGEEKVLQFPHQLVNHPLQPNLYSYFSFYKVFFAANTFVSMDHGHHSGRSRKAEGVKKTRLIHLHFHHKRFDLLIESAKRSWVGTISPDDREQLLGYSGPSIHLVPYLLTTKEEYYSEFLAKPHFFIPSFRALLRSLQAPLDLPTEAVDESLKLKVSSRDPSLTFDVEKKTVFVPQGAAPNRTFIAMEFNEIAYLADNPDVAVAGADPLFHFCHHGFQERRSSASAKQNVTSPKRLTNDPAQTDAIDTPSAAPEDLATLTPRQLIASYVSGNGPIRPLPDGSRCIELGSGGAPRPPGWLATDLDPLGHAILHLDVTHPFPIDDRSFDFVYSQHMIEHLTFFEGHSMLRECFRILKPGGRIRVVTPSISFLTHLCSGRTSSIEDKYIQWAVETFVPDAPKVMPAFVFNNFVRGWGHQFIYDRSALELSLADAGFVDITECEISQSEHEVFRNLETVDRMPEGFLALESMILEARKSPQRVTD